MVDTERIDRLLQDSINDRRLADAAVILVGLEQVPRVVTSVVGIDLSGHISIA
jgi:hypothetical protein